MLIDGKSFFDAPVKTKEEAYEEIISIGKNNDYTIYWTMNNFRNITN